MSREQSTNTLLCLFICWRCVARGFATQTQAELSQSTNTEGGHECRNTKLILFDSTIYLSHWPFETSGPKHWTFEQSDTCFVTFEEPSLYLWACSVSADGNNIEHKTENYDKLRGLSSHNYGHTTLLLLYTPSHITLLHQPMTLIIFGVWPVGCMVASWVFVIICMAHQHTPSLYLGLDIMFKADNKTKSGIIQP